MRKTKVSTAALTLILTSTVTCAAIFSTCANRNTEGQRSHSDLRPAVIGYVAGYNGLIDPSAINASLLTHINYAFVDIRDNRAWLHHEQTDTANFRLLNLLKKRNPSLKIMISIGGWSWSKNFSDAVLTDTSRKAFAISAAEIAYRYNLDGVDIDWEYPNMRGDGNIFRKEDKHHYTLMFAELRKALDSLGHLSGKRYQLTTAVGAFPDFIANTEMRAAQEFLDYVNLMTYDYSWGIAGHHTNLHPSTGGEQENSAEKAVRIFQAAGVPANKLVMGIAFYGRGGIVSSTEGHGLNQKIIRPAQGGGFSYLRDSLIDRNGFVRYWDEKAHAPYLFNEQKRHFISYDDENSVKDKCLYVQERELGGVMFWEYSSDPKEYLLKVIHQTFERSR